MSPCRFDVKLDYRGRPFATVPVELSPAEGNSGDEYDSISVIEYSAIGLEPRGPVYCLSPADPDGELGEEHEPETHLIPLVLQTALGRRPSIAVFGTDYETPDGTCIRDYVHVTDLAAAHVAALSACPAGRFAAYNLGSGRGASINDVIACARKVTGKPIAAVPEARRAGDPAVLVADASLARTALEMEAAPFRARRGDRPCLEVDVGASRPGDAAQWPLGPSSTRSRRF